jgi:hypothetical protein
MAQTRTISVPGYVVGERVGICVDDPNPGVIREIDGVMARVRWDRQSSAHRRWYRLEELVAFPSVKVGDRVGYRSANDPNPGTVIEVEHSRARVKWDNPFPSGRWFYWNDLVVLPEAEDAVASCDCEPAPGEAVFSAITLNVDASGFREAAAELAEAVASVFALPSGAEAPHIVCLVRDGQPLPSPVPHVHQSFPDAESEAQRLAGKNPGEQFAVYRRVSGVRSTVSVEKIA